jgi:putative endonuclease
MEDSRMKDTAYIYFMANTYNTVLYVGVTNDIVRRVAEHKAKINKGFTFKYNADKLVYFEQFNLMTDAIAREKQIKNWKREWKNALINKENTQWNDLAESIGVDEKLIISVREHYQEIAGQARNDDTEVANDKAESEFEKFSVKQDKLYTSDFDRFSQLEEKAKH